MTNKVYTFAGIVNRDGRDKVRWTNDLGRRVKKFNKRGSPRVDFVALPSAMTKVEALRYLQTLAQFQSAEDQALISDALVDREKSVRSGISVKTRSEIGSIQTTDSTDETVA